MSLRIVAIGKRHEGWIVEGVQRYQKRLRKPYDVEWVLLPHSSKTGAEGADEESQRIKSRLKEGDFVILLDERGKELSSPALSELLQRHFSSARDVTLLIGGAYGVSEDLRRECDFVWSLSPLVFPHQLVRLMLIEQIYRVQSIANSEPYHHD